MIRLLEQGLQLIQQPVLLDFTGVAVGAVFRVDEILLVLVEPEIAEYKIGHRLVQVAEEQHLAQQVLLTSLLQQPVVQLREAFEKSVISGFDQVLDEVATPQACKFLQCRELHH